MTYREFPQIFDVPRNKNVMIWRYMDFTKFVSLLDKKALFFSRADKLGDPFEGAMTKVNLKKRKKLYGRKMSKDQIKGLGKFFGLMPKQTFINCWCMRDYESAALWRLYLQSNEGIAIQSTFKRLAESFNDSQEIVYIGMVNYIDYEKDSFDESNTFKAFLYKRKSFEFEHELRAVLTHDRQAPELGKYVSVELDRLIDRVYISPTAPRWFGKLAKSIVRKYEINKEVVMSKLAERPVY